MPGERSTNKERERASPAREKELNGTQTFLSCEAPEVLCREKRSLSQWSLGMETLLD